MLKKRSTPVKSAPNPEIGNFSPLPAPPEIQPAIPHGFVAGSERRDPMLELLASFVRAILALVNAYPLAFLVLVIVILILA